MRHRPDQPPICIAQDKVHRLPAGITAGGLAIFKRGQKCVTDKRVCAAGNGIPFSRWNTVYRGCKIKGKGIAVHPQEMARTIGSRKVLSAF